MAESLATHGVVIHSLSHWPCRVCRPRFDGAPDPILLCVNCAEAIAAGVVEQEGRAPLASDFARSLPQPGPGSDGWSLVGSWDLHSRR